MDPTTVEITYLHRGAPGDQRTVGGSDVEHVGHGYMELDLGHPTTTQVPLHRVLVVRFAGEVMFDREARAPSGRPSGGAPTSDPEPDEAQDEGEEEE